MVGMSNINRALTRIAKRAERNEDHHLHATFVDSGIADTLDNIDNQVLYGRRGTGKTHAFIYLAEEKRKSKDLAIFLDLRTIGSPDGITDQGSGSLTERATRLLIDLLGQLRDEIYESVFLDESLMADARFTEKVDDLLSALTNIHLEGDAERFEETEKNNSDGSHGKVAAGLRPAPTLSAEAGNSQIKSERHLSKVVETGKPRNRINFSDVARALRELAGTLSSRRVWLFLDEWSSIPRDLQPYLGEFLLRCVLPLQKLTVKIAAIEQQSSFIGLREDGQRIGLELGADISATVSLDDFMVYEGNEDTASRFFLQLIYRHLIANTDQIVSDLNEQRDVVRIGFTDRRAFEELVRAAEGVPRDLLHIAGRAATKSMSEKISVNAVREAAKFWYTSDKLKALESRATAREFLEWVIDRVIREKKARAFLATEADGRDPLLVTLFDARMLHIIRRGYSAQDMPGERFDVWSIDYGAYVDLIQTKNAPQGLLLFGTLEDNIEYVNIDVPVQDLRAIRRAILDLEAFRSSSPHQP